MDEGVGPAPGIVHRRRVLVVVATLCFVASSMISHAIDWHKEHETSEIVRSAVPVLVNNTTLNGTVVVSFFDARVK